MTARARFARPVRESAMSSVSYASGGFLELIPICLGPSDQAEQAIGQRRPVAPRLQRMFRRQTDRHHCVTRLHRRAGDAVDRVAIDW